MITGSKARVQQLPKSWRRQLCLKVSHSTCVQSLINRVQVNKRQHEHRFGHKMGVYRTCHIIVHFLFYQCNIKKHQGQFKGHKKEEDRKIYKIHMWSFPPTCHTSMGRGCYAVSCSLHLTLSHGICPTSIRMRPHWWNGSILFHWTDMFIFTGSFPYWWAFGHKELSLMSGSVQAINIQGYKILDKSHSTEMKFKFKK